ncbi:hypothetical protein BVI2075_350025 [Burkholderia vietnamiensis]|nr:hypothetical protein BVI2075_350025 [Burkholderia vietnamiensis]
MPHRRSNQIAIIAVQRDTRRLTGRQGLPTQTIPSGKSENTELRAPTNAPRPMVTPGATNTSAAIHACSSTRIDRPRMAKSTRVGS